MMIETYCAAATRYELMSSTHQRIFSPGETVSQLVMESYARVFPL